MPDGDKLILGQNNNAQSQTNLTTGLGDESGSYGLRVTALDGNAVGGLSALGLGIEGVSNSGPGIGGTSPSAEGVVGRSSTGSGVGGSSTNGAGVRGASFQSSGVEGLSFGPGAGVTGAVVAQGSGPGVVGLSNTSFGVRGQSGAAVLLPPVGGGPQFQRCGVQGSSDDGTGVRGDSAHRVGVRGRSFAGDGVFGSCSDQPSGPRTKGNGVHGQAPRPSPDGQQGPFAGKFDGDVKISGHLYVGNTLVAHPRLMQAPLAVASGLVNLDRKGEAVVTLPKGLGELHSAFRYQLTAIGGPAPNLHVAQQVRGDKFKIAGGTSRLKVSWQIAGELKDRRLGIEHAPEKPFDQKMAQEYNRQSKEFARRVEEIKRRTQRVPKKR